MFNDTPPHQKQIGYWVSEKGKCNKMVIKLKIEIEIAINKSITF